MTRMSEVATLPGTKMAIDAETLERMARIARGFVGRTISVRSTPRDRSSSDCTIRIDGVSAAELLDGYFAARE